MSTQLDNQFSFQISHYSLLSEISSLNNIKYFDKKKFGMDSNEAPDDYYHFRESEFDAEDNQEKYGVYLVEQHQVNSVDPYVARNQKKPRNTQEYTETIPQHSRPRKPIVQDIYTEDHYCIARSSGNWTSDVGVQDVDGDTMKTTEKNGICSFRKIMIAIIVILLLLIISGLSGFVLYHYLNEKGENDHIKKIDNLNVTLERSIR